MDHGTAFDIARKNMADHEALREALRQAVDLAPARDEVTWSPPKVKRPVGIGLVTGRHCPC